MDSGCPSSQGLNILTGEQERFTRRFQHDKATRIPSAITPVSVYQDKGDLLWVGTENGGLNLLSFRQEQFGSYRHRPRPNSLSPGKVTAIY